ncbi:MAG: hypothetical protein WCM93_07460 [Bacteroidota bacterium]
MESKFEFKDYMNNILSGLLWETSIIMIVYLFNPEITAKIDWVFIKDFQVVLLSLLIVIAFFFGIILRATEFLIIKLHRWFFGDPYYNVLCINHPQMEIKTGVFYSLPCFKKKLKCLDFNICKGVVHKLKELIDRTKDPINEKNVESDFYCNEFNSNKTSSLRNLGIMAERYLMLKGIEGPYIRFKDIKNFFESVSFPLFLSLVLAKWTLFTSFNCCLYFLILAVIFILFLLRYNYYFRNYVKDVYRFIFFAEV